jgi:hypothetical protein
VLATATETQSPFAVAVRRPTTVSMAADAAEAADDEPRASMMAAPRFCTVVMKSPRSQAASVMTSVAGLPPISALAKSGYWVAEWLPQIATREMSRMSTPALRASCALARFSSSRVMANQRSAGTPGALDRAIRQFVLQGFPTTRMRTSEAALAAMASPCGLKIPPFTLSRSPRSMPALRGTEPTRRAQFVPSKAVLRSDVATMSCSSGNAPSSSSMQTPSRALRAGSISRRRSTIGWSSPSSWPEAMRKSSE